MTRLEKIGDGATLITGVVADAASIRDYALDAANRNLMHIDRLPVEVAGVAFGTAIAVFAARRLHRGDRTKSQASQAKTASQS